MKKTTLITASLLAMTLSSSFVKAEASTEKNVGFFSGALAGAAVGGPIGFIIGGVSGAVMGDQVDQANQLGEVKSQLEDQQAQNLQMQDQLVALRTQNSSTDNNIDNSQWITQGLTLNLMFTTNSAKLSDADRHMIARLSKILEEYPELSIKLDGYADPRGEESLNLSLSQARTDAVEAAFEALGIASSRLTIQAHGESNASAKSGDLDAYAMERRVSVNFFTKQTESVAQN